MAAGWVDTAKRFPDAHGQLVRDQKSGGTFPECAECGAVPPSDRRSGEVRDHFKSVGAGCRTNRTRATVRWRLWQERQNPAICSALREPEEIRRSRRDPAVLLFHRSDAVRGRWVVAVTKHEQGDGFLVTAYRTDAIKEGERLWPR